LGIGPNPQSPIPNPQSPIPKTQLNNSKKNADIALSKAYFLNPDKLN